MSDSKTYVVDATRSPHARLRPVPIAAVHLTDDFIEPRRRVNREKTLPTQYAQIEASGCLDNFRRVSGVKPDVPFRGPCFMDSDLYKWLEAAASALINSDESTTHALLRHIDEAAALIEDAQRPDGYLNTYFARERADERWTNLRDWHEMYCAGHFIQAALAHYRATGSTRLLGVARRVADNLCDTFGPADSGRTPGVDGHPEIETALVELYRATGGESRYLDQARYFIDARGQVPTAVYDRRRDDAATTRGGRYHQDHVPYRDLNEVTGHAVRMLYLAAGATDAYLETGEAALKTALDAQWHNRVTRRMYVSGGLGARHEGEAFGKDFELPAERAYTETCAAIAGVMWDHRMLMATGDARYADLLEWTLYNAVLPGLSLEGEHYFYENPLSDDGTHRRVPWFQCACCPPNVARLLAQLPGYVWSAGDDNSVWAHLYADGEADIMLPDGQSVGLSVRTRYPWDGEVTITLRALPADAADFTLNLRVPVWCADSDPTIQINGETAADTVIPGTYAPLRRTWRVGDTIRLSLPMPVRFIEAHPYATDAAGRIALARGPLIYCAESVDHPGIDDIRDLALDDSFQPETGTADGLPGDTVALRGRGVRETPADRGWPGDTSLYHASSRPLAPSSSPASPVEIVAVPYCYWANRAPGRMEVWLRRRT